MGAQAPISVSASRLHQKKAQCRILVLADGQNEEFWLYPTSKMKAGAVGRSKVSGGGRRVEHNKFAYRIL